ncbi:MAG: FtsX-like permease family protein [Deltaproteobacteria bacterium]
MRLPTVLRINLRYYGRHRLLALLCLLGISLGVGIVVAVELINDSALSSFASSVDFLSGKATHSVISGYGRIDEDRFMQIWTNPDVEAASPVVEVMAQAKETGDEPIRFLGLDPLLDAQFRNLAPREANQQEFIRFLSSDTPAVYLSGDLMERYGLKKGDLLTVLTAGVEKKVRILGALPGSSELGRSENLAILDIAAAQEIFGRSGYLDRIDIIAPAGVQNLRGSLPAGLELTDRTKRKSTLQAMLYSLQMNLAAMSLLALFVGTFLIYNFSMFSVLSRREDTSLLLTLGSDRRDLLGAFLTEALLLGAGGSVLGIGFGFLVAWFSIERVASSISELYFYLPVDRVHFTPPKISKIERPTRQPVSRHSRPLLPSAGRV